MYPQGIQFSVEMGFGRTTSIIKTPFVCAVERGDKAQVDDFLGGITREDDPAIQEVRMGYVMATVFGRGDVLHTLLRFEQRIRHSNPKFSIRCWGMGGINFDAHLVAYHDKYQLLRFITVPFIQDGDKRTPLMYAAANGSEKSAQYFLMIGTDLQINMEDRFGCTAFMYAIRSGSVDTIARFMHNPNTRFTYKDAAGNSPLALLARTALPDGFPIFDCVLAFVKKGADVNGVNFLGETPLMFAVLANNPVMVTVLLMHGADVEMENREGETVFDLASKLGNTDISVLLSSRQKNKNVSAPVSYLQRKRSLVADQLLFGNSELNMRQNLNINGAF